ncbi:MAG: porin [Pseudomonas sp.]|nr:porin [Pseudomonas sp.]
MQKKLIALAIAGLVSAPAFAQSNVTIYGLVDMGVAYRSDNVAAGVGSKTSIDSGIANGNRLGFRGTEDLGNGLKAGFVLEQGFYVDQGTGRGDGMVSRQSYLSLGGGFGTVLAGRVYTFQDQLRGTFDPFGNGTVGQIGNVYAAEVRLNNTVAYVSPNFSGFTVKAAYSTEMGDNQSGASGAFMGSGSGTTNEALENYGDTTVFAISPMYQNGPLTLALNYHQAEAQDVAPVDKYELTNWDIGASYDFGVAKLAAMYGNREADDNVGTYMDRDQWMVGVTVPVGAAGAVLASWTQAEDDKLGGAEARQWALGYTHALSKRTGLYAVYADIKNDAGNAGAKLNAAVGDASNGGEGYQEGFQVGLRHSF